MRDLVKAGDALLEAYLNQLCQFTLASYQAAARSPVLMVHASKLNQVWQRVLFEAQALKVSCQP